MPFGFFFGFDFLAEFFVFGVFGFAAFAFAFVVDFFDLHRIVFRCVRFAFVVFIGDERRCRSGGRQAHGMRGSGRGEQEQRGEQEDQQEREFPHAPCIGAGPSPP